LPRGIRIRFDDFSPSLVVALPSSALAVKVPVPPSETVVVPPVVVVKWKLVVTPNTAYRIRWW